MVFPKVMSEQGFKLADDALVLVRGRVDGREDVAKLMCLDVTVIEAVSDASGSVTDQSQPHERERAGDRAPQADPHRASRATRR